MLYFVKPIESDIGKLHQLLVHFFQYVQDNSPSKFDKSSQFPEWYSYTSNSLQVLEKSLKEFVEDFDISEKNDIIYAFTLANKIELFFESMTDEQGNMLNIPIAKDFPKRELFLNNLFLHLYKSQLSSKTSTFFEKIGDVSFGEYFTEIKNSEFSTKGSLLVCPFCGIHDYKLIESEGRPPFDHILPKGDSLFVFSSINLKNLIPICDACNTIKDTRPLLYLDKSRKVRTLAFYPYSTGDDPYSFFVFSLTCTLPPAGVQGQWTVNMSCNHPSDPNFSTRATTWLNVFNILSRYSEYISNKSNYYIGQLSKKIKGQTLQQAEDIVDGYISNECNITPFALRNATGILLENIFHKWILQDQSFLSNLVLTTSSPLATNPNPLINSTDYD
ncbi:hypothetical protein [Hymenobacter swuensis]|uniref:HNH domain-containing protein n=1 Tax=Hymenobacter swuensis DY53 TaxID=1227739 RepID=W8EU70_9BACT|nr:hypothetical protein [Hymenobacter swuensis]AHJ95322.1 hypothetical protein Hsw_PB0032 [Hymenobacter swuensis DY53]